MREALLLSLPLLFLVLFFYFPLSSVLIEGFTGEKGRVTLTNFSSLFRSPYYRRIIGFTIFQAVLSTLFSLGLALPGAYLMSHYRFPGKRTINAVTTVPFVLPSILVVLGFVLLFGNNGLINRTIMAIFDLNEPPLKILYSLKAIILAHGFYNFPIFLRIISGVWQNVSEHTVAAAKSLGGKGVRLFFTITFPQILPGILSGGILVFLFCFLSFAVILVLGGGPQYTTMEVEIFRLAKFSLDFSQASALAVIQLVISVTFLFSYLKLQSKTAFQEKQDRRSEGLFLRPLGSIRRRWNKSFLWAYTAMIFILIILPLSTVIGYSFLKKSGWSGAPTLSLHWYRSIFSGGGDGTGLFAQESLRAVINTVWLATVTTVTAVPLGVFFSFISQRTTLFKRRFGETLVMLPMGISSIMLGLGYIRAVHVSGIESGSWLLIIFAHCIISYPFVIRSVDSVYGKIDRSLLEASRSLGANGWRLFRTIELPLIKAGIITGAAFAFAISVGEINATLLLAPRNIATIPITMYRLISAYNFSGACALGSILMTVCITAFLVIEGLGNRNGGV
jgi:thiamine transport system permease protein